MTKIFQTLILLTLLLNPLSYATSQFGFEQNKVIFFIFASLLTAIFWLLSDKDKKQGRGIFGFSKTQLASLVFICSLLISSLFGINLRDSLLGNAPYFQGWALYAILFLFSLMVSASKLDEKRVGWAFIGSGLLVSVVAIFEWVLIHIFNTQLPTYAGRVVSTFGQPNFFSGFILLTLPFLYADKFATRWKEELFLVITLIISALGIAASESRIAIFLFILFLLYYLVRKVGLSNKYFFWGILIIAIIGISLSVYFKSGIFWKEVVVPFTNREFNPKVEAVEKRANIWPVLAGKVLERPIVGYGLENMQPVFSSYNPPKLDPTLDLAIKGLIIDRSHNIILDILTFSGLMGLLTWGYLVFLMFKSTKSLVLRECLIFYLVWSMIQNQSIVQLVYFWTLVGLVDNSIKN